MPVKRLTKKDRFMIKKISNQMVQDNLETKHFTLTVVNQQIGDSGSSPYDVDLCALNQGDGTSNRDGHSVRITGIYFFYNASPGDPTNLLRTIVYMPKGTITDTLAGHEVYSDIDQDKYTVLYDQVSTMGQYMPIHRQVKRKFNKGIRKGIKVQWKSSSSTDFTENRLRLRLVSDSGAINHVDVSGYFKVYYKDA